MPNSVTPEEREKIVGMLRDGVSQGKTAREVGRSPGTVNKIAREEGVVNIQAPKKANEARRDYAKAERIALGNEFFERVRDVLRDTTDAGDLKDLAATFGILTDKRRLDDNQPTDIGERRQARRSLSGLSSEELDFYERILSPESESVPND